MEEFSVLAAGSDQVGQQIGNVGAAQAGYGIPSCRSAVSWYGRILLVAVDRDVVEIGGIVSWLVCDTVKCRVDEAEIVACYLIGDGDEPGPLW